MPPLNKSELNRKLEEYAELQMKICKINAKRNAELDPFISKHNEEIAPVLEKYSAKLDPLNQKSAALQTDIETMLKANTDKDGNPKILTHSTRSATVMVSKSEGARVVSVTKFFDAVKDKTASFWNCLKVEVAKADKLIGKEKVDEISEKKTTFPISISLNK